VDVLGIDERLSALLHPVDGDRVEGVEPVDQLLAVLVQELPLDAAQSGRAAHARVGIVFPPTG
jgi:hypothetical protein